MQIHTGPACFPAVRRNDKPQATKKSKIAQKSQSIVKMDTLRRQIKARRKLLKITWGSS